MISLICEILKHTNKQSLELPGPNDLSCQGQKQPQVLSPASRPWVNIPNIPAHLKHLFHPHSPSPYIASKFLPLLLTKINKVLVLISV